MDTSLFEFEEKMEHIAQYVLNQELVSGAAEGISKQVVDKGWSSLSKRQKEVFENYVTPLAEEKCECCGAPIPHNELDSFEGICSYCDHSWNKWMAD